MNGVFALNALLSICVGIIGLALIVGLGIAITRFVCWITGEEGDES